MIERKLLEGGTLVKSCEWCKQKAKQAASQWQGRQVQEGMGGRQGAAVMQALWNERRVKDRNAGFREN